MAVVLLSLAAGGARGQWKIVGNAVVTPHYPYTPYGGVGAISFKDGVLWAGFTNLAQSTDSGRTWTLAPLGARGVTAISFVNRDSGIVGDAHSVVRLTRDGGASWTVGQDADYWNIYDEAPSRAYGIRHGGFLRSTNGGQTWDLMAAALNHDDFGVRNGNMFVLDGAPNAIISNDAGLSWMVAGGKFDEDSYSIGLDSCDPGTLYVVAENEYAPPPDSMSKLFVSTDLGASWKITFAAHIPCLSGSFTSTAHAEYAATISQGILRSTDQGETWMNIGGPGTVIDSRCICAISDNIVFALDSAGNIWATFNSGGYRIADSNFYSKFSVSPSALFTSDTISCDSITGTISFHSRGCSPPSVLSWQITGTDSASYQAGNLSDDSIQLTFRSIFAGVKHAQLILNLDNGSLDTVQLGGYVELPSNALWPTPSTEFTSDTISCDSITHSITFSRSGCTPPRVSSWSLTGPDSASFSAGSLTYDSILVTLHGITNGSQHAQLVLDLDNGSSDTVQLAGYVNINPSLLALSTQDQRTDTLGATIQVPITINGLERPEDVNLVLHYDGSVDYLGSFSPNETKLDVPGGAWPGRSLLHLAGAIPGAIAGYAEFNVFSDSGEDAHAMFDSLDILTAISPCEYSSAPEATSTIYPPTGCAIPILSQFVHLGKEPVLSVRPNPSNGNVWLFSAVRVSNATVTVYDMLGTVRSVASVDLAQSVPTSLSLPEASGVYTILVRSGGWERALRIVRQ